MTGNSDFRAAMETVFAAAEITGDLLQEMKDDLWREEGKFSKPETRDSIVEAEEALTELLDALYVVEGTMRLITSGDSFHAVKEYFSKETDQPRAAISGERGRHSTTSD